MSGYDDVTPGQVAEWDRKHKEVSDSLDALIDAHRANLADGEPRHMAITGMGAWLAQRMVLDAALEHLVVAIDRLAALEPLPDGSTQP